MKRFLPKNVRVPKDLDPVTAIDAASEAEPSQADLSGKAVHKIWGAVRELYRSRAYPAVTVCVRRHGHIVLNRAIGHAAGNGPEDAPTAEKRLAQPDTPVCAFSATKAVTATLIHKLAEEGGLRLHQRVSHFIPEFAQNGKGATTIEEVLSHRGGFPMFELPKGEIHTETLLDWPRCIQLICDAPPTHVRGPGRSPRLSYHAVTGGYILAEILQRVTGRPIAEYLDAKLRKPLGMQTFTYGLAPEHRQGVALNYAAGAPVLFPITTLLEKALILPIEGVIDVSNTETFMDAVVPAGNLYCTAEELSRFYQMLLDGGVWNGQEVLRAETVARLRRPASDLQLDHTLKIPMRYSEGFMLGANPFGIYGPMTGHAFGHLGFMNILGWADPQRGLAVGLMVTGKSVLGRHLFALGEFLTTLAWQCRQ
jgi:CubicO group peptidase (beta-lactamase class C family)